VSALLLPIFVKERWQSRVPLARLFWVDLLAVGTVLNLFVGFTSLMLLAQRADWLWVVALHAIAVPYNLFLAASVWRHPRAPRIMKLVGALWCLGMLAI
jgi:hypothetical protein